MVCRGQISSAYHSTEKASLVSDVACQMTGEILVVFLGILIKGGRLAKRNIDDESQALFQQAPTTKKP